MNRTCRGSAAKQREPCTYSPGKCPERYMALRHFGSVLVRFSTASPWFPGIVREKLRRRGVRERIRQGTCDAKTVSKPFRTTARTPPVHGTAAAAMLPLSGFFHPNKLNSMPPSLFIGEFGNIVDDSSGAPPCKTKGFFASLLFTAVLSSLPPPANPSHLRSTQI